MLAPQLLATLLLRSDEMETALLAMLASVYYPAGMARCRVVRDMGQVALEHGRGVRRLLAVGLFPSAMGLFRLQYEAQVRTVWLWHVAGEGVINKLQARLGEETARQASNALPGMPQMLEDIRHKGPPGAHRHLNEFHQYSWRTLNAFVHSGLHPLQRGRHGYPLALIEQVIRQSNNLLQLTALAIATPSASPRGTKVLLQLYAQFADCLQLDSAQSAAPSPARS